MDQEEFESAFDKMEREREQKEMSEQMKKGFAFAREEMLGDLEHLNDKAHETSLFCQAFKALTAKGLSHEELSNDAHLGQLMHDTCMLTIRMKCTLDALHAHIHKVEKKKA